MKRFIIFLMVIAFGHLSAQKPSFRWVKYIPFEIVSQCADDQDNIYIAGDFRGTLQIENHSLIAQDNDIVVAKYNRAGTLLWVKQFGGTHSDHSVDIECDHNNDLIIKMVFDKSTICYGDTLDAFCHGVVMVKLTSNGNLIWYQMPYFNETSCVHTYSTSVDQNNHILITGSFSYGSLIFSDTVIPSQGPTTYFMAKYHADGSLVWVRKLGFYTSQHLFDDSNNVLLFSDSVFKYSPSNQLLWKQDAYLAFLGPNSFPKVGSDSLGHFYMAPLFGNSLIYGGDTLTTNDSSHFILAQFDASGMLMMTKTAVSPNNFFVNSVSVHKNRVLLTGTFQHHISFGNESLMSMNDKVKNSFVIGYDLTGNLLYHKKMDSRKGCDAKWVTAGRSVFLSGSFSDTAYFDDMLVVKDQHDFLGSFLAMLEEDIQPPDIDKESFKIYPNPAVGSLTIEYQPLYKEASLEIFDLHGKLVDRIFPRSSSTTIDVGHLRHGLYIIKLNTEEKVIFLNFLKI